MISLRKKSLLRRGAVKASRGSTLSERRSSRVDTSKLLQELAAVNLEDKTSQESNSSNLQARLSNDVSSNDNEIDVELDSVDCRSPVETKITSPSDGDDDDTLTYENVNFNDEELEEKYDLNFCLF